MKHFNSIKISLTNVGDILAIVIFFIFALASRTLYNGPYSPFNNWLSDLGNSSINPSGYIYFDIGYILLGFAVIIQTVGLVRWKTINRNQDNLILISQYCGLLMAIAVIMVGIFSEDYGRIHYIVAAVFFALLLIFMTIINIVLKTHTKYIKWIWYYVILSILTNVTFILTFIIGLDIYILEWLVVL
jgi:hypothetical membrane protein